MRTRRRQASLGKSHDSAIQKMRALAVVAVIFFHSKSSFFPNGYLGVDVFFVISGYLILPKMIRAYQDGTLREFYFRRIRRLTPAFSVMLIVSLLLILAFSNFSVHQDFIKQSILSLLFMGNFGAVLISGNYFSPQSFMPLLHTWSLSVEEQIYFFLPMILRFKTHVILPVLGGISFVIYFSSQFVSENAGQWFFYMTLPRVWEFLVGGFIALRVKSLIRFGSLKFCAYLVLFLLTTVLFLPLKLNSVASTILVVVLSALILDLRKIFRSRSNLLSAIGDRSYSLYLYHMPIIYIAKFSTVVYGTDRTIHTLVAILITFIAAEISFRKIEFRFVGVQE